MTRSNAKTKRPSHFDDAFWDDFWDFISRLVGGLGMVLTLLAIGYLFFASFTFVFFYGLCMPETKVYKAPAFVKAAGAQEHHAYPLRLGSASQQTSGEIEGDGFAVMGLFGGSAGGSVHGQVNSGATIRLLVSFNGKSNIIELPQSKVEFVLHKGGQPTGSFIIKNVEVDTVDAQYTYNSFWTFSVSHQKPHSMDITRSQEYGRTPADLLQHYLQKLTLTVTPDQLDQYFQGARS
jgi:hypothetical protein